MTQVFDWQGEVGRKWARLHTLTDRAFSGLTQHLLERLERLPGDTVLDIGCGAGELSLALARRRPGAEIVGVDVSADLVSAARSRAGDRANVRFIEADAATWDPAAFRPDLLTSRHGVMFFPDPVAAFAHLHELAAPGANLLFSCFRDRRLNPWASEAAALLPPEFVTPADPLAPGPFAFADDRRVAEILIRSGWNQVHCQPLDFAYVVGMGDDPVAEAREFLSVIGPAAAGMEQLRGTSGEAAFLARMTEWLRENAADGMVSFPAAAWIVSARAG